MHMEVCPNNTTPGLLCASRTVLPAGSRLAKMPSSFQLCLFKRVKAAAWLPCHLKEGQTCHQGLAALDLP